MNQRPVLKADRAWSDIRNIAAFIARDNATAAANFVHTVNHTIGMIQLLPTAGRFRFEGVKRFSKLQSIVMPKPFTAYVIVYRVDHEGITMIRVLHSAQGIDEALL